MYNLRHSVYSESKNSFWQKLVNSLSRVSLVFVLKRKKKEDMRSWISLHLEWDDRSVTWLLWTCELLLGKVLQRPIKIELRRSSVRRNWWWALFEREATRRQEKERTWSKRADRNADLDVCSYACVSEGGCEGECVWGVCGCVGGCSVHAC